MIPDDPREVATVHLGRVANEPTVTDDEPPVSLAAGVGLGAAERYETRRLLGRGGMGEVHLCLDKRIGRQVAMKSGRGAGIDAPGSDRFVREICVQGQLEHPCIVPLYDLATTPDGAPYFTMKHVRGKTLRSILAELEAHENEAEKEYPLRRLLGAFASVCLAAAFAHARGVVHRDLKPDNIMLGDFGEVYVLDWGVAKIASDSSEPTREVVRVPPREDETIEGSAVGTLGYMAPEQLRGELERVDSRADAYSLGAILFEILAGQKLHEGNRDARISSTLEGVDARVHLRAPDRDAPPEIEALCVAATAIDPADRTIDARGMHAAVEAYLSHDRNVELRRVMAAEHARAASRAAEAALAAEASEGDHRKQGVREAGRALALDPYNEEARLALVRLLTQPPRETPEEVRVELEDLAAQRLRGGARLAAMTIPVVLVFAPVLLWMGVRSWAAFALFFAFAAVAFVVPTVWARSKGRPRSAILPFSFIALSISLASTIFGPFVGVPAFAGVGVAFYNSSNSRHRVLACACFCGSFVVPALAGWLGLPPATFTLDGSSLRILPVMVAMPAVPAFIMLLVTGVGMMVVGALVTARMRDELVDAERRLAVQAWQLRQLVPAARR